MFPIGKMSKVLEVSRSSYYHWLSSEPSARSVENRKLTDEIGRIHAQSRQIYGSPRITAELNAGSKKASRPRVARLMQKAGIRSKLTKKYRVATTDSKHGFFIAPNLLDRDFKVGRIGKVWVSDITYIPTAQGVALPHHGHRSGRPKSYRLGIEYYYESRGHHRCCLENGRDQQTHLLETHISFRPRCSIRLYRVHRPSQDIHKGDT